MSSALENTHNARALGGLPLSDGATVSPRVVFRSDALDRLTPAALGQLAGLGVGTVVDLRTDAERLRSPDALPTDGSVTLLELPVQGGAMDELVGQLLPADHAAAALTDDEALRVAAQVPSLDALYVSILEVSAGSFATLARTVLEAAGSERPGVLFHCTAGKDRTGLAAALLLTLAGADREVVVDDYTQTETNLAGPFAESLLGLITALGIPVVPALRTLATESPAHAIESALDWVEQTHGDVAAYLVSGGLAPDEVDRLREHLRSGPAD